jgi:eukaryotic-like serine/threonine-protein kinase
MRPATKQIFFEVCDLDPETRRKRVAELCGNDQELRREVERLLRHDSPESIFDSPAPESGPSAAADDSSFTVMMDDTPNPWIGRTILGYRLVEPIGQGGMGEVYRAEDTRLKRSVAVKFLASRFLRDDQQKRRFLREAQAAAALDHPSICPVYDVGEIEGRPYIVTAFLEGENLAEVIQSGDLPVATTLDYVIQIAKGLQAAHLRGIVHRDMKPGNVILATGRDGGAQAKIIDFGLARISGSSHLTERGGVVGTAAYIAPEILQGHAIDPRADIWSLGVMLYEMLTSYPPFDAENRERLFYLICNEDAAPLASVRPSLPEEATRIVAKTLQKDREKRYQNVRELLADLKVLRRQILAEGTASPSRQTASAAQPALPAAEPSVPKPARIASHDALRLHQAPSRIPERPPGAGSVGKQTQRSWALVMFAVVALIAVAVFLEVSVNWEPAASAPFARIGMLPFEDLSPGESNDRIVRGIEEALSIRLAGLSSVRLVPPSLVASLQEHRSSPRDIVTALHLDYLVTGSVARSENALRTTVNLISGSDLVTLWSKAFDSQWTDFLKNQSELAEMVVGEMGGSVVALNNSGASVTTQESDAYDSYLKAQYSLLQFQNTRQPEFLQQAEQRLRRALELDPDLTDAMAGMVELRLIQLYPPKGDRKFLLSDAADWLDRVRSKGPANSKANSLAALIYLERGESLRGLEYARSAVASEPGDGEAHYRLGCLYSALGFYESTMVENEKSIAADLPTFSALGSQVWHLSTMGKFAEAEAGLRRILSFDAESIAVPVYALYLETMRGEYEKVREMYEADNRLKSRGGEAWVEIGAALVRAAAGETEFGRAVLQKHLSEGIRGFPDIILLATVVGDADLMATLTRESPYFNNYRWVVGNPFINNIKDKKPFRDLVFDLHKTWEANLAKEERLLPVRPPVLPRPEVVLAPSE